MAPLSSLDVAPRPAPYWPSVEASSVPEAPLTPERLHALMRTLIPPEVCVAKAPLLVPRPSKPKVAAEADVVAKVAAAKAAAAHAVRLKNVVMMIIPKFESQGCS